MKKALKITLSVIAVLLAVILLVGLIAPKFIKKEETKFTSDKEYAQTEIASIVTKHFAEQNGKDKKALIIGLDGTRRDQTDVILGNNGAGKYLLENGGGVYKAFTGGVEGKLQPTVTACGWTTILTGKWADEHGVDNNGVLKNPSARTFITKIAQDYDKNTALFVTYSSIISDTLKEEKEFVEKNNISARYEIYKKSNELAVDTNLNKAMREELAKTGDDSLDLLYGIYDGTDVYGHSPLGGFTGDRGAYAFSVTVVDDWAKDLIDIIEARDTYENEDWLIMLVSDHGGLVRDHMNQTDDERNVYFFTNKKLAE